jgi:uncharacterized membrane protein HdeD (DUF308 family)
MEKRAFKNFGFFLVNGLIAIVFGIILLAFTQETIKTIVTYFGVLVLAGGAILLITSIRNISRNKTVFWPALEAIMIVAIGIIIMLFPQNSLRLFLIIIGVWAILSGIVQLVALVNLGKSLSNKNVFLANGLLTMILGLFLILYPPEFASFMAKMIGVFSILFGAVVLYLSFAVRSALKKGGENPVS